MSHDASLVPSPRFESDGPRVILLLLSPVCSGSIYPTTGSLSRHGMNGLTRLIRTVSGTTGPASAGRRGRASGISRDPLCVDHVPAASRHAPGACRSPPPGSDFDHDPEPRRGRDRGAGRNRLMFPIAIRAEAALSRGGRSTRRLLYRSTSPAAPSSSPDGEAGVATRSNYGRRVDRATIRASRRGPGQPETVCAGLWYYPGTTNRETQRDDGPT